MGASDATQPCSAATPAGFAFCGLAVDDPPAAMVVVVVVWGTVVVVVLGGSVVDGTVVVGTTTNGIVVPVVPGTVVVVVVDGTVVGTVGGVVVMVAGTVVVVDGTVVVVVADPVGAAPVGVGAVMATVVQAPASLQGRYVGDHLGQGTALSLIVGRQHDAARDTALAASSRRVQRGLDGRGGNLLAAIRSAAVMLRYCWATTPSRILRAVQVHTAAEIRERRSSTGRCLRTRRPQIAGGRGTRRRTGSCAADTWDTTAANCRVRVAITP